MSETLFQLALANSNSLFQQGSFQKAREYAEKALNLAEKSGNMEHFFRAVETLAGIYMETGEDELCIEATQTIVNFFKPILEKNPGDMQARAHLTSAYFGLGALARKNLDIEAALYYCVQCYQVTYDWLYQLKDIERPLHVRKFQHSSSCEHLCDLFKLTEDWDNLAIYGKEYANLMEELVEEAPYELDYQYFFCMAYYYWGSSCARSGRIAEAEKYLTTALNAVRDLGEKYPANTDHLHISYYLVTELGKIFQKNGNPERALEFYNEQYILSQRIRAAMPANSDMLWNEGVAANNIADIYIALGRLDEALPFLVRSEEIFVEQCSDSPDNFKPLHGLHNVDLSFLNYYLLRGDLRSGVDYCERSVKAMREIIHSFGDNVPYKKHYLGMLKERLEKNANLYDQLCLPQDAARRRAEARLIN